MIRYIVHDMNSAREYLKNNSAPIEIQNAKGSTFYYGMLTVLDMLQTLKSEFTQVKKIIVDIADDNSALFTANKLNIANIVYDGRSDAAKLLVANIE